MNTTNSDPTHDGLPSTSADYRFGFGPQLSHLLAHSSGQGSLLTTTGTAASDPKVLPPVSEPAGILREHLREGGYVIDSQVCEAILAGLSLPDDAHAFLAALERVVDPSTPAWTSLIEQLAHDILTEALGSSLAEVVFTDPPADEQLLDRMGGLEHDDERPAQGTPSEYSSRVEG